MESECTFAKMYSPKISLVIPCFNEAFRLPPMFEALEQFAEKWKNVCEFILVNDGSSDSTAKDIENSSFFTSGRYDIKLIHQENKGKGGALKLGVSYATGEYILTLDADMAAKPTDLLVWLEKKKRFTPKEILIGSRELKNSHVKDHGYRKFIGNIFNFIISRNNY